MLGALNAHGTMEVGLPAGPPLFRFTDPQECAALFADAGLTDMTISKLQLRSGCAGARWPVRRLHRRRGPASPSSWRGSRPRRWPRSAQAVRAASADYEKDGMLGIPMTSVLVSGRKP